MTSFETIIHDLSQYLRILKQMGIDRVPLCDRSVQILAAWGRPELTVQPRQRFTRMGPASATVVIVDGKGTFFTGEAGALLKKILQAMKLSADRVCLCNAPDADQVTGFLESVHPKVVIALGDQAARVVTGTAKPVAAIRGKFVNIRGLTVMPTFHPAQLLEDPALKRPVWEDMQQVMQINGIVS
ncbi:MAG: uracil-DNA glycosylase [Desulfotignum sp.]|nr:uracil-DNA glycosylase [Desulfotignum sp.]